VAKIPRSRRWRVTAFGHRVMSAPSGSANSTSPPSMPRPRKPLEHFLRKNQRTNEGRIYAPTSNTTGERGRAASSPSHWPGAADPPRRAISRSSPAPPDARHLDPKGPRDREGLEVMMRSTYRVSSQRPKP
jgi:hypothetical protein